MADKLPAVIGFRLKKTRDADIMAWLQSLPKDDRSYHIRAALRAYMGGRAAVLPPPARQEVQNQNTEEIPQNFGELKPDSRRDQEPEPLPAEPEVDDDKLEQALASWAG